MRGQQGTIVCVWEEVQAVSHARDPHTEAHLRVRIDLVPAAEHGREHGIAMGQRRPRGGPCALAALVERDGV